MPTLVVQMGHCFRKTGATGTEGEQPFAAEAAEAARLLLDGRDGWTVRKILADDDLVDYRGDAFVAIHCDGSTSPTARGASVGYRTPEGQALGQAWKRAYAARGWEGFRPDNYTGALSGYYGTGNAVGQGNRRAIIVESGFLTNPEDRAILKAENGPVRVALAIGDALGIRLDPPQEEDDMSIYDELPTKPDGSGGTTSVATEARWNAANMARLFAANARIETMLAAMRSELSDDETNILAAIRGMGEGVTPEQHAAILRELLPDATLAALMEFARQNPPA